MIKKLNTNYLDQIVGAIPTNDNYNDKNYANIKNVSD